jgi:hypothetical protein
VSEFTVGGFPFVAVPDPQSPASVNQHLRQKARDLIDAYGEHIVSVDVVEIGGQPTIVIGLEP